MLHYMIQLGAIFQVCIRVEVCASFFLELIRHPDPSTNEVLADLQPTEFREKKLNGTSYYNHASRNDFNWIRCQQHASARQNDPVDPVSRQDGRRTVFRLSL